MFLMLEELLTNLDKKQKQNSVAAIRKCPIYNIPFINFKTGLTGLK